MLEHIIIKAYFFIFHSVRKWNENSKKQKQCCECKVGFYVQYNHHLHDVVIARQYKLPRRI